MLKTLIKIQPAFNRRQASNIAAWMIPGDDARRWVNEIVSWNVDDSKLQLILVPKSRSNLDAIGLLVIGDVPARESVGALCIPFVRYAERLLIPAGSELAPCVDEKTLNQSMMDGNLYVWHPGSGLISIEDDEIIGLSDLLSFGLPLALAWDGADPGVATVSQLTSIQATQMPSLESVLDQGRDDIGERADDFKDIPPPKDGSDSAAARVQRGIANGLKRPIARLARFLTSNVPERNEGEPNWINGIEDWANRTLQQVTESVMNDRHKELSRLMKMLESDPDKGLKFALPLDSWAKGRGLAPPGGRLSSSSVNFNLGSLFGFRGATDFWDIPGEMRSQLNARYRELAQREINLGRYRRAAYIYAHLLGDLSAAAKVLEQGGHFREAAVLYKDKIKSIDSAINCLERGHLFNEAIEICVEHARFEKAGDIYRHIGQEEKAIELFRKAAEVEMMRTNRIAAARIEERKIGDIDQAVQTLSGSWPESNSAVPCLAELFRILREHDRNEETSSWIDRIAERSLRADIQAGIVNQVSQTATQHPLGKVREQAADATRVIVSRIVSRGGRPPGFQELLSSVARLNPEDRLLRRDCTRFQTLQKSTISKLKITQSERAYQISIEAEFDLPEKIHWLAATGLRDTLVAVGAPAGCKTLAAIRCSWDGTNRSFVPEFQTTSVDHVMRNRQRLMDIVSGQLGPINGDLFSVAGPDSGGHYGVFGNTIEQSIVFPESNQHSHATLGKIPGQPKDALSAWPTSPGRWTHVRNVGDSIVIDTVDKDGRLISSRFVCDDTELEATDEILPATFYASFETYFIGLGQKLFILGRGDRREVLEFDQTIVRVAGSVPGTLCRVAVAFEWGIQVLWGGIETKQSSRICQDLYCPRILFTRTGHLIVASENRAEVYATKKDQLQHLGTVDFDTKPIALIRANDSNHFATMSMNGRITIFKIPLNPPSHSAAKGWA